MTNISHNTFDMHKQTANVYHSLPGGHVLSVLWGRQNISLLYYLKSETEIQILLSFCVRNCDYNVPLVHSFSILRGG